MSLPQNRDPRLIHSRNIFAKVLPSISESTHPNPKNRAKARTVLMLNALRVARPVFELPEI